MENARGTSPFFPGNARALPSPPVRDPPRHPARGLLSPLDSLFRRLRRRRTRYSLPPTPGIRGAARRTNQTPLRRSLPFHGFHPFSTLQMFVTNLSAISGLSPLTMTANCDNIHTAKVNTLITSGRGMGPMKPRQPAIARCQFPQRGTRPIRRAALADKDNPIID